MTKEKRSSLPGFSTDKQKSPIKVNSRFITAYAKAGGTSFRHGGRLVTPSQAREALKPFFSAADTTKISKGNVTKILGSGNGKFRMLANKGGLVKEQPIKSHSDMRKGGLFK